LLFLARGCDNDVDVMMILWWYDVDMIIVIWWWYVDNLIMIWWWWWYDDDMRKMKIIILDYKYVIVCTKYHALDSTSNHSMDRVMWQVIKS
jgi:hypothetical protein